MLWRAHQPVLDEGGRCGWLEYLTALVEVCEGLGLEPQTGVTALEELGVEGDLAVLALGVGEAGAGGAEETLGRAVEDDDGEGRFGSAFDLADSAVDGRVSARVGAESARSKASVDGWRLAVGRELEGAAVVDPVVDEGGVAEEHPMARLRIETPPGNLRR